MDENLSQLGIEVVEARRRYEQLEAQRTALEALIPEAYLATNKATEAFYDYVRKVYLNG